MYLQCTRSVHHPLPPVYANFTRALLSTSFHGSVIPLVQQKLTLSATASLQITTSAFFQRGSPRFLVSQARSTLICAKFSSVSLSTCKHCKVLQPLALFVLSVVFSISSTSHNSHRKLTRLLHCWQNLSLLSTITRGFSKSLGSGTRSISQSSTRCNTM